MYGELLLDHFLNPRNVGSIKDADGIGTIGDPGCGDYLCVYIKVQDNRLVDVKFQVYGCPAAIATSSILTEMAKGKTLEEGLQITDADVAAAIGGLPEIKLHCSNLGASALHEAILNYQTRMKAGG
ncbi:NIF system FeS cluster assembly, NifU,N-terminal [Moorella glycerini]|uniref:NifU-like protein n=1 Tax=Neomoorella stamsii TaxID=1266720 RepID=A0A9X7J212_9FIRM|nr:MULTISPECIES: iron-sulfur cluster assembly scaffold protein NifU [Moorella]PRR70335.1 NifU-like protein [Moorella stamsii]CEP66213.1 NIF system FeS cluster assembly, NifU,N-terminal [Moorella glycerini]CEP66340.1 NIF system FeS cluster assembly, NifU,N-terminal [Moorella glycerini]